MEVCAGVHALFLKHAVRAGFFLAERQLGGVSGKLRKRKRRHFKNKVPPLLVKLLRLVNNLLPHW